MLPVSIKQRRYSSKNIVNFHQHQVAVTVFSFPGDKVEVTQDRSDEIQLGFNGTDPTHQNVYIQSVIDRESNTVGELL